MIRRILQTIAVAACLAAAAPAEARTALPRIQSVVFDGANGNYSVTITGKDFGKAPDGIPCKSCQPLQLQIIDIKSHPKEQRINVTSWSNTQITVENLRVLPDDSVMIAVYNQVAGHIAAWGGPIGTQDAGTPVVDKIGVSGSGADLRLVITGSGFGDAPPRLGLNFTSPYFVFTGFNTEQPEFDNLPWNAGFCNKSDCNYVTVNMKSWTDTEIVMTGFGSEYGGDWTVNPSDAFCIGVWSSSSTSGGTTGGTFACGRAPK